MPGTGLLRDDLDWNFQLPQGGRRLRTPGCYLDLAESSKKLLLVKPRSHQGEHRPHSNESTRSQLKLACATEPPIQCGVCLPPASPFSARFCSRSRPEQERYPPFYTRVSRRSPAPWASPRKMHQNVSRPVITSAWL